MAQLPGDPRYVQYTATASQTVFAYGFIVYEDDEIIVKQNGTTLTLTTEYTVQDSGETDGGTITLVTGATADDTLTIKGNSMVERDTTFIAGGDYLASAINGEYDKLDNIAKELVTASSEAFRLSEIDTDISKVMPDPSAGLGIKWNAGATALVATTYDPDAAQTASAASAAAAAADAILTAADVVSTNADVVTTNADAVTTTADAATTTADVALTNADVVSTNADVVLTNADVVTSGASASAASASQSQASSAQAAAAVSAAAAAADLVLTNADVVLTNADVVSTNADVVSTNADVVTTNADAATTTQDAIDTAADVVLTNADVVLTAADEVLTNADALATAADKVATNADVVLTNADVVTTNADAATTTQDAIDTAADVGFTNADVVSTNADVVLTNADVVLTNADVVSAAASAASINNAALGSDIIPDGDSSRSLGSTGVRWLALWTDAINGAVPASPVLFAQYQHNAASGADGGTYTQGAWRDRPINTEVYDGIGCSVSSNLVTAPAGTYIAIWEFAASNVGNCTGRITSSSGTVNCDPGMWMDTSADTTNSHIMGQSYFVAAGSTEIAVEMVAAATNTDDGFGAPMNVGVDETYLNLLLIKVA